MTLLLALPALPAAAGKLVRRQSDAVAQLERQKAELRKGFERDTGLSEGVPVFREALLFEFRSALDRHFDAALRLRDEEALYLASESEIESFQKADAQLKARVRERAAELGRIFNTSLPSGGDAGRKAAAEAADEFVLHLKKFERLEREGTATRAELEAESQAAYFQVEKALMLSYKAGELAPTARISTSAWWRSAAKRLGFAAGGIETGILLNAVVHMVPWNWSTAPAGVAAAAAACYGISCLRRGSEREAAETSVWRAFTDRLSIYAASIAERHGKAVTPGHLMQICESLLLGE